MFVGLNKIKEDVANNLRAATVLPLTLQICDERSASSLTVSRMERVSRSIK